MNQHTPRSEGENLWQVFAQQLLHILRANVEQAARLSEQLLPASRQSAAQQAINSVSRREIAATLPALPAKETNSSLGDPEFEAALMEMVEREGWWHGKPDEIIEQFDWMLVGLITLQEEYVKYCARKELDPATALPSLSRLAAGLGSVVETVGLSADLGMTAPHPRSFRTPSPSPLRSRQHRPTKPGPSFSLPQPSLRRLRAEKAQ